MSITQAPIGSTVHDLATVTGSGPTPTGTVNFTWFTNTTCTGDRASPQAPTSPSCAGIAHPSNDETVTTTGGSFKAHYNGDANYNPSDGACEPVEGLKLTPGIVTVIHAGPGAGDTTAAPAIVVCPDRLHRPRHGDRDGSRCGTPTGDVTFTWFANTNCTGATTGKGTIALVAGIAHPSGDQVVPAAGGSFQATYNGSAVYTTATSACEPLQATKLNSTHRDLHPFRLGQPARRAGPGVDHVRTRRLNRP